MNSWWVLFYGCAVVDVFVDPGVFDVRQECCSLSPYLSLSVCVYVCVQLRWTQWIKWALWLFLKGFKILITEGHGLHL